MLALMGRGEGEERYRRLIHFLPLALWQVDSRCMIPVFEKIIAAGVVDINSYLNEHPEIVEFACDSVIVSEANLEAMKLMGAEERPEAFLRPVRYIFEATPGSAQRVIVGHFEGKRNYTEVMKVRTFDGRLIDVLFTVTYPNAPERLDVSFLSMQDLTGKLEAEAQIRKLQADYARAARVSTFGELASCVAHEIKQPLAAVVMNGEAGERWLTGERPDPDRALKLLKRMVASARRASDIIDGIHTLIAKHKPERVMLDIEKVIDESLLFVRHDLEAKSIELDFMRGTRGAQAFGDRVLLQQLFVNLILNSIQAISGAQGANRKIRIATNADSTARMVVVEIHDSGPGIPDEIANRIFESFFTTKGDGLGIGLSLCHSIVSAHEGWLTAHNHDEGGAIFRIRLPYIGAGAAAMAPSP